MTPASFQLTARDLTDAQRLHLRESLTSRRGVVTLGAICVVAVAAFGAILWREPDVLVAMLVFAGVAPIAAWGTPVAICYLLGPRAVRRTMRQQKGLGLPVSLSWTDDTVRMESAQGIAHIAWADFHKLTEDARLFLFYESERLYRLVPKRVLSAEEIADLSRIVAAERRRRADL